LSVASTRSIGGFPGRFSTSGSEVWDEENISISFQLLHGPAVDQRGQIGENRVVGEVLEGTARSRVMASLSADSDVPPRSKN
jgi:hypothetical protein